MWYVWLLHISLEQPLKYHSRRFHCLTVGVQIEQGRVLLCTFDCWRRKAVVAREEQQVALELRKKHRSAVCRREMLHAPWYVKPDSHPGGAAVLVCWARWRLIVEMRDHGVSASGDVRACRRTSLMWARRLVSMQECCGVGNTPEQRDIDLVGQQLLSEAQSYAAAAATAASPTTTAATM